MTQKRGITSGLVVAFTAMLCISIASSQLDVRVQSRTPPPKVVVHPRHERVKVRVVEPRHHHKKRPVVIVHEREFKHDNGLHLGQHKNR